METMRSAQAATPTATLHKGISGYDRPALLAQPGRSGRETAKLPPIDGRLIELLDGCD